MTAHLRLATLDDAPNLAALSIQVWLHTYATTGIRTALADYVLSEFTTEKFIHLMADPSHVLILAELDHHLLGYANLHFNSPSREVPGTTTELATLYVQEHFAGKGIGTQLMSACRTQAHQRTGNPDFWLSVYYLNQRALTFYQKHGLSIRGSFDFEFGGERHQNYVLGSAQA